MDDHPEVTAIEVYRSGPVYLVKRGRVGILVMPEMDTNGPRTLVGSIVAHTHVSEPWEATDDYGPMATRVEAAIAELAEHPNPL